MYSVNVNEHHAEHISTHSHDQMVKKFSPSCVTELHINSKTISGYTILYNHLQRRATAIKDNKHVSNHFLSGYKQNMDPWSMDHLMDPVHGYPIFLKLNFIQEA